MFTNRPSLFFFLIIFCFANASHAQTEFSGDGNGTTGTGGSKGGGVPLPPPGPNPPPGDPYPCPPFCEEPPPPNTPASREGNSGPILTPPSPISAPPGSAPAELLLTQGNVATTGNPAKGRGGDPVAFSSGSFQREETLFWFPNVGPTLQLILFHDSQWKSESRFGWNWSCNFDQTIHVRYEGGKLKAAVWYPGNFTQISFGEETLPGVLESHYGNFFKLRQGVAGEAQILIRDGAGNTFRFNNAVSKSPTEQVLWLTGMRDSSENSLWITRYSDQSISHVSAGPYRMDFRYYNNDDVAAGNTGPIHIGKVKSVRDHSGREYSFRYDEAENLERIVHPESEILDESAPNAVSSPASVAMHANVTRYEYSSHFLVRVFEDGDNGLPSLVNQLEANWSQPELYGRITKQIDASGNGTRLYYKKLSSGLNPSSPNQPKMGVLWVMRDLRAVYRTLNLWGQSLEVWDFESVVEPGVLGVGASVDSILATLTPASTRTYAYDKEGRTISILHPEGNSIEYVYDDQNSDRLRQNDLIAVIERPGPRGDGGSGTGARDRTRAMTYEPLFGRIRSSKDPEGQETKVFFDYQESPVLDPALESMASLWGINLEELPELGLGDLNLDGSIGGARGNAILARAPDVTQFDLKLGGNPSTVQANRVSRFRFNNRGQLIHAVNAEGEVRALEYFDEIADLQYGQVSRAIGDPEGLRLSSEFSYDERGNLIRVTDPRGVISRIFYSRLNQVVRAEIGNELDPTKAPSWLSPVNAQAKYFYDRGNNLVRAERLRLVAPGDTRWVVRVHRFDAMNRLVEAEEQLDIIEGITKTATHRFSYDPEGRLVNYSSPEAIAAPAGSSAKFQAIRNVFDGRGFLCQQVVGEGDGNPSWASAKYDRNGNVASLFRATSSEGSAGSPGCAGYALGDETRFVYDGFDRRTQMIAPGGRSLIQGWTELSQPAFSVFMGPTDGLTSPIAVLASRGWTYDEAGRILSTQRAYFQAGVGPILDDEDHDGLVQTLFQYDRLGRPVVVQNDRGKNRSFYYDALGRLDTTVNAAGSMTTMTFDAGGLPTLIATFDPATDGSASEEFQIALQHDALGHLVRTVDLAGRSFESIVDFEGKPLYVADANGPLGGESIPGFVSAYPVNLPGNVTRFRYDDRGRVTERHHYLRHGIGDGHIPPQVFDALVSSYTNYDRNDRPTHRIDANGNATQYLYDAVGRLLEETRPDGKKKHFEYDADSRLRVVTLEDGSRIERSYDSLGIESMATTAVPVGVAPITRSYRFDGLGRMTSQTEWNASADLGPWSVRTSFQWDSLSRLRAEASFLTSPFFGLAQSSIATVSSRYDGVGNRTQWDEGTGIVLDYQYDDANRLRQIHRQGGLLASYEYVGSRLRARTVHTGVSAFTLQVQYDEALFLSELVHQKGPAMLAGFHSEHDRMGNRLCEARLDSGGAGDAWQLDSMQRMESFRHNVADASAEAIVPGSGGVAQEIYENHFDPAGNRLAVAKNGAIASVVLPNELNQIESQDGASFNYDIKGNLLNPGTSAASYRYDALNRLQSYSANGKATELIRDGSGRVLLEATLQGGALLGYRRLLHGEFRRLQERQHASSGSLILQKNWTYGSGLDELLEEQNSSHGSLFPLQGMLGSTHRLVNASGDVVESYEYPDGCGTPQFFSPTQSPLSQSAVGFDRLFAGARFLSDAGLYDLRHRHYDPKLARFLNPDPLGVWGDAANQGNSYAYVANNPQNFTDPHGLASWGGMWKGVQNVAQEFSSEIAGAFYDVANGMEHAIRETYFELQDLAGYLLVPTSFDPQSVYGRGVKEMASRGAGIPEIAAASIVGTAQGIGADLANLGSAIINPASPREFLGGLIGGALLVESGRPIMRSGNAAIFEGGKPLEKRPVTIVESPRKVDAGDLFPKRTISPEEAKLWDSLRDPVDRRPRAGPAFGSSSGKNYGGGEGYIRDVPGGQWISHIEDGAHHVTFKPEGQPPMTVLVRDLSTEQARSVAQIQFIFMGTTEINGVFLHGAIEHVFGRGARPTRISFQATKPLVDALWALRTGGNAFNYLTSVLRNAADDLRIALGGWVMESQGMIAPQSGILESNFRIFYEFPQNH